MNGESLTRFQRTGFVESKENKLGRTFGWKICMLL